MTSSLTTEIPITFDQMQSLPRALFSSIDRLGGRHPFLFVLFSGALLILCFPHADLGCLSFVALAPFLRLFPLRSNGKAFWLGLAFGFTFFAGLLYWIAVFSQHMIGLFGILAWLILSTVEATQVAIFSVTVNFFWTRVPPTYRLILIPSVWTLTEWLRQLGSLGMGWGDLGYTLWHSTALMHLASLTGIWGLSWVIVFVNGCMATGQRKTVFVGLVVLGAVWVFGRVCSTPRVSGPSLVAASLQANINEDVPYWGRRPASFDYFRNTLETFAAMADDAHRNHGATLCVTAETAIPGYPRFDPVLDQFLRQLSNQDQVTLVTGAHDTDLPTGRDTNSVFMYAPGSTGFPNYRKHQLVPFGEYVPYRNLMPFLKYFQVLIYDEEPGRYVQSPVVDPSTAVRPGIAICYESTYPGLLRWQIARGANVDMVVTDDTWFGKTAAARQHMAMSAIRAAETDRYLVRAGATGISAIFRPNGSVESEAGLFRRAVVYGPIQLRDDRTLFVRWGDWFVGLCGILLVGAAFLSARGTGTGKVNVEQADR